MSDDVHPDDDGDDPDDDVDDHYEHDEVDVEDREGPGGKAANQLSTGRGWSGAAGALCNNDQTKLWSDLVMIRTNNDQTKSGFLYYHDNDNQL